MLVSKLHLPTLRALAYARATRPDVLEAVTVSVDDAETRELVRRWEESNISVPLKVIASPYREITRPILDYVKRVSKESPRTVVTVFIPEYVVGHWWEQVLHNQSALRLKGRLLFMPGRDGDIGSLATQFVGAAQDVAAACGSRRRPSGDLRLTSDITAAPPPALGELTLTVGAPANGGSCVARHDGRVVFVRYALPGERVRVRVTADRGSYWHAEAIEVIEPSADRIASLCPIAGVDGAGCCDLAFVDPAAARALKAEVVSNQLARLGNYQWNDAGVQPLSAAGPTGWRTRIRLDVGADGRAGFHRYHSDELVTDLHCGQLPAGMIDGLTDVGVAARRAPACRRSTTTVSGMWCARCATAGATRPRWSRAAIRACSESGGTAGRCR